MAGQVERPSHVDPNRVVDLDIFQPVEAPGDFFQVWKDWQDAGLPEVVWTPHNGGHWVVLRGRLVDQVASEYERFSNHTVIIPKEAGEHYRLIPLSVDPPQHGFYRKILNDNLFSPAAVAKLEPQIREYTVNLIESFVPRGRVNFTKEFAELLPIKIFISLVDLPEQDAPRVKHWADQFTRPDGSMTLEEVSASFRDYLVPIINDRRGSDRTDLISMMVNGDINGRPMNESEAVDMCTQVLVGGLDTVINLMGFVMSLLAKSPEVRREIASNPQKIPTATAELIRRLPVVCICREIAYDFEFEGVLLKKGEMIAAPTILHGLDDRENPDPMAFDMSRKVRNHSTFGRGHHFCPGSNLARAELKILLEEWLSRIPEFEIAPESELSYTSGIVSSTNPFELVWAT